jgi:hypothetical protein
MTPGFYQWLNLWKMISPRGGRTIPLHLGLASYLGCNGRVVNGVLVLDSIDQRP